MDAQIQNNPVFTVFTALVLGILFGYLGAGIHTRFRSGNGELHGYIEQVNRDLGAAIDSQREAAERASRLQADLRGITEYARNLEERSGQLAARTGSLEIRAGGLSEQLGGIIGQSGELTDGIIRAQDSLEESRVLLDELGTVLRRLPGGS